MYENRGSNSTENESLANRDKHDRKLDKFMNSNKKYSYESNNEITLPKVIQDEKSTPQRTLNASLNLINEPVMTSRQVALKSKMKDCSHNSHSNEAAQIPNKAEEAQDIPTKNHESIYQQFNNAIKPGFDLELALK